MNKRTEIRKQPRKPSPASIGGDPNRDGHISPKDIGALAYSYWKARGCHGGSPEEDWLRAEQELQRRQVSKVMGVQAQEARTMKQAGSEFNRNSAGLARVRGS